MKNLWNYGLRKRTPRKVYPSITALPKPRCRRGMKLWLEALYVIHDELEEIGVDRRWWNGDNEHYWFYADWIDDLLTGD